MRIAPQVAQEVCAVLDAIPDGAWLDGPVNGRFQHGGQWRQPGMWFWRAVVLFDGLVLLTVAVLLLLGVARVTH